MSGWVVGQRLGWAVRTACAITGVVSAVAVASVPRATAAGSNSPTCTSFVSAGQVARISGLATKVHEQTFSAIEGTWWRWTAGGVAPQGNIAGSDCLYLDVNPPAPFSTELTNTGFVAVGFGESSKNFRKLRQVWGAGGGSLGADFQHAPASTVRIAGTVEAFENTVDL